MAIIHPAAGKLNRRITIQQQSTSQDEFGQLSQVWTPVRTCRASIKSMSGSLLYSAGNFISKSTHSITMRWSRFAIPQPNMRIIRLDAATGVTHTYVVEAWINTEERNVELVALVYELDGAE